MFKKDCSNSNYKMSIKVNSDNPICCSPRRLSYQGKDKVHCIP